MRASLAIAAAATIVLGLAARAQDMPPVPAFLDETASAGLSHVFGGDWEFIVGGGAAAFDCSGDLKPEIFLAGGVNSARLWRNDSPTGGALRMTAIPDSGLELTQVVGAYPLDIDSDGLTDLVVLRVGENQLMRGLGDCRFAPANAAWGFDGGDAWSTAFSAMWEAGQTWPTLAIGNYIDRHQDMFPWGSCTDNWLSRPAGQGFAAPLPLLPSFCALSMLFTDWDRSGTPDLRVSNDREYYKGGQEQLWRMEPGAAPVLWTEAEGWAQLRIWGMGIASTDLNDDGYPEYFLTSMADNKLQSLTDLPPSGPPRPGFADIAYQLGAIAQRPYVGGDVHPSTAWHAQFGDTNNDGRADLFIAKGNVSDMPDFAIRDPDNLLLQRPDGSFAEAGDLAGLADMRSGRGAMLADFNLDGWLDLVVVNRNDAAALYRNTGAVGGHWWQVRLAQTGANRDGIGAWVELRQGMRTQRIEVTSGGGHASGGLGWLHFGLGALAGAADLPQARVIWPDGVATDWADISPDGLAIWSRQDGLSEWAPPE